MKAEVQKVFDDLENYTFWCSENGMRFNQADLYQRKSPWGLMERERCNGLLIENQWEKGARIFRRNIKYKGIYHGPQ